MKILTKDGMCLNPNPKVVEGITKALERNGGYCPCVHDEVENKEDTKCPCKKYREEDICICKLYVKY